VKCLIESGQLDDAKKILTTFNENDDDFIGEVDLAELYAELKLFEEAIFWYDKGWESYYKQPDWIAWYVYSLLKKNQKRRSQEIINEVIQLKKEELVEAHEETINEEWSGQDKQQNIIQLSNEIKEYQRMIEKVSGGVLPQLTFEPSPESGCYLFGCKRHGHPEYEG
jgi:tetratricopeptide (TPR) repeat protein